MQTAWAVLALTAAKCTDRQALARGVQFLRDKQVCFIPPTHYYTHHHMGYKVVISRYIQFMYLLITFSYPICTHHNVDICLHTSALPM